MIAPLLRPDKPTVEALPASTGSAAAVAPSPPTLKKPTVAGSAVAAKTSPAVLPYMLTMDATPLYPAGAYSSVQPQYL